MTGPFSRGALAAVIAVAAASLIAAVVLMVLSDDVTGGPTAGANSYSDSAIGYRGLVRLLEQLEVPVTTSRSHSGAKAGAGLVIVAEPDLDDAAAVDRLRAAVAGARAAVSAGARGSA